MPCFPPEQSYPVIIRRATARPSGSAVDSCDFPIQIPRVNAETLYASTRHELDFANTERDGDGFSNRVKELAFAECKKPVMDWHF